MTEATLTMADRWFAAYSADHQHPLNQRLHTWCVPAIVWSITALLYVIPASFPGLVSWLFAGAALLFWWATMPMRVSVMVTVFMVVVYGLTLWLHVALGTQALLILAIAVFVIAWIGQFIGHHVEGKRPSFFTDLVYLMIGPPWVLVKLLGRG